MEGSGSVHLTNGSETGRPKNLRVYGSGSGTLRLTIDSRSLIVLTVDYRHRKTSKPTTRKRWPLAADRWLPTIDRRRRPFTVDRWLPTADCRPLTANRWQLTVDRRPLTADRWLPTVDSRPLTVDRWLPTADCQPWNHQQKRESSPPWRQPVTERARSYKKVWFNY
jgi:hypothetical protein